MKKLFILNLLNLIILQSFAFAESKDFAVNIKTNIDTVLELSIEQTGQSELRFGNVRASATQVTETAPIVIKIHITSNIGESYQIIQSVGNALENSQGNKIDLGNLKFKTTAAKTSGSVISTPTPVSKSSQTIFTSDAKGTSDTIQAEYTLSVPASQAPGDYSALLTYTVSSL